MSRRSQLVIDLGDLFTKGIAQLGSVRRRLRFPSVIARRLATANAELTDLTLGEADVFRPEGFDPGQHGRARSYPEGQAFRRAVHTVAHSRYVGWQAVAHGSDRQLLGIHPTEDNIEALFRKALLLGEIDGDRVDTAFVVGTDEVAAAVARYVAKGPRTDRFLAWTAGSPDPRRVEVEIHFRVVDWAACAFAALPPNLRGSRFAVVDIGYRRTKFAILSDRGCEHQADLAAVGVSDCVHRILRDEQEQGLVEDEFAVIRALERSQTVIDVAGRRFDVRRSLDDARRALEQDLAGALDRALRADFERALLPCSTIALIGGGAQVVGSALATRIKAMRLGVDQVWVCPDSRFFLSEGALGLAPDAA